VKKKETKNKDEHKQEENENTKQGKEEETKREAGQRTLNT
jgi:hypothetical protein